MGLTREQEEEFEAVNPEAPIFFETFLDMITPAEDVLVLLLEAPNGRFARVPKDNFMFDGNGQCIFVKIGEFYHPWHRVFALKA